MIATHGLRKVAFLGDYIPRQCGIATFTADLRNAVATQYQGVRCDVVAVNDRAQSYDYPGEVRFDLAEQELEAYQRAADFLNLTNADVVCLQHEFGIYGGVCGSHILALMRALRMPVVTTLHTVLRDPTRDQLRVMKELVRLSSRVIVMAERGRDFLLEVYGTEEEKIDVIPHGIPDVPFVDPNFFKDQFGVEGKQVLLTFGLLSPNKGIGSMIEALPAIAADFPDVVYMILGATHPNLIREQGETYRIGLERLAKKLGVQKNVLFFNRFVGAEELTEFIGAADIYVTPYLNEAQITSGTLAYSFGAGKAVVSTPYWHASELLADGCGMLIPFGDSSAIADAVRHLLGNETARHAIRKRAYKLGREMIWSNVAHLYAESFEAARREQSHLRNSAFHPPTLDRKPAALPAMKLDHLRRMSDSAGILQHAVFTLPDWHHGYCTDDNARALILTLLLGEIEGSYQEELDVMQSRYSAFLQHAFHPDTRRFRNFMSFERRWLEDQGSEDSHARALWALGTCVGRSPRKARQQWAGELFGLALAPLEEFTSPRSWAFAILGLHEYLRVLDGDRMVARARDELAGRLMRLFEEISGEDWVWFEDIVSYDNAKIPHALILTGRWNNQPEIFETGLRALRWLCEVQSSEEGHFRPIGSNGFLQRGQPSALFDQQPIEAHAMVSACLEAHRSTSDGYWLDHARRAFDWFLGYNDLGQPLYDPQSGGCQDGLHVDRINQNQGAESTLAFLLSLAEMSQVRDRLTAFELEP